jgi:hypothetical protein
MQLTKGCSLEEATMSQTNTISGYELVIMNDRNRRFLGWIRLLDGQNDAGYVYITDDPVQPHLGGVGRLPQSYVVMSRPIAELGVLLSVLNDGRAKTIRFADNNPQDPSAFIEHAGAQLDGDELAALGRFGI